MKSFFILALGMMMMVSAQMPLAAQGSKQEIKFYSSSNYNGSNKTMKYGTYQNVSNWRYNSYKLDDACCVKFYYYDKRNKVQEKRICGSKKDIKSMMRNWDTKYGWSKGWKNIKYIEVYCKEGGNDQAHNTNQGGGNMQLRKGHFIMYNDGGFKGGVKEFGDREYDTKNWNFNSCKIHRDCYLKVWYYTRNGKGEKELRGSISDLRGKVRSWGLKHGSSNPFRSIYKVRLYCGQQGGGETAGSGQGGGNMQLRKGYFLMYNDGGYKGGVKEFGDKEYETKNWNFNSCKIHRDCYLKVWYYTRNGKGEKELRGSISDLRGKVRSWGLKHGSSNPFRSIYKARLYCGQQGGGNAHNDNNNNDNYNDNDYRSTEWYGKAKGGRFGVVLSQKHFEGKYKALQVGTRKYDDRRIGIPIGSIYVKENYCRVIVTYRDYNRRQKTEFVTKPIKDFEGFLLEVAGFKGNREYKGRDLYRDHFVSLQFVYGN